MSGMTGKREETIDLPPDSLYQPMNEDFKRSNVNRSMSKCLIKDRF